MKITIYNYDRSKSFSIKQCSHNNEGKPCVWINQDGEGGAFDADEVCNVLYEAIEKYFNEKF